MMTCQELTELLLEFVAEQLPPERRDHAEQHLRSCHACTAYVGSYRILVRLVRRLPDAPLPQTLLHRFQAILADNSDEPQAP